LDKPSVLVYLKNISEAVVGGVKVLKVEGSSTADSFKLSGIAKDSEALRKFTDKLKRKFSKVNTDVSKETSKGVKFAITVSGVKSGD
jgi:Tfp pilus assembly protein PilN